MVDLGLDGVAAAIAVLLVLHFVYKLMTECLDKSTVKESDQWAEFEASVEPFAL